MKKKVLSLLLTLCLVMTFVPMAAFAAETNRISITTVAELWAYDFQFRFFRKLWKDRVSVFRIFQ